MLFCLTVPLEVSYVFRTLARENPRHQQAWSCIGFLLAGVWHRLGRREKVRAEYERLKGFDPKVAERIRTEFGVR